MSAEKFGVQCLVVGLAMMALAWLFWAPNHIFSFNIAWPNWFWRCHRRALHGAHG